MRKFLPIALFVAVMGCQDKPDTSYTLYRNSPLDLGERVWFASFNAEDSIEFNGANCSMTARLLNANFIAANRADGKQPIKGIGFWCEKGPFREKGPIPMTFQSAFPANSESPLEW